MFGLVMIVLFSWAGFAIGGPLGLLLALILLTLLAKG